MISRERIQTILICLLLTLGTGALYGPAIWFDYIHFDDPGYVFSNVHVLGGFTRESLAWSFQAGYASNWHPLTWFSHVLDVTLYGARPGGHHLTNVILHIANSGLLLLLLKRMTGAFWRSAIVAALFAWHPCHVESVAWISERKDVLSGFFFLLTLWAYHGYAIRGQDSGTKRSASLHYGVALLCFALGLMAKPMLVTVPFVLFLLDWWPLRRFPQTQPRQKGPAPGYRMLVIEKIPFFALALASSVLTMMAQTRGGAVSSLSAMPFSSRIINPCLSYLHYVEKLFWPKDLAVLYPFETSWSGAELAAALAFLAVVSFFAFSLRRTHPFLAMGWCWFLGTLVPVIGFIHVGMQSIADRYTYLPSIGLFIIVCWGLQECLSHRRRRQVIAGCLAGGALVSLAAVAGRQLSYWKDSEALFSHTVAVTRDNFVTKASLGSYYLEHGQLEKARIELEEALRIAPRYPSTLLLLGNVLKAMQRREEAISHYRMAIDLRPDILDPHLELAKALLEENRVTEAAAQLTTALEIDYHHPGLHFLMGRVLALQGKLPEAEQEYLEVLRLRPTEANANYELATVLGRECKTAAAIEHYEQALRSRPNFANALNDLAWIRAANADSHLRDGPEAVRLASRACSLTFESQPIMIGTLAAAYAEAGRFAEAVASAQKAHDLAEKIGQKELAARNLELMESYRSGRAYHEPDAKP